MEKILVTGAAGFIGSNLCGALLAKGHAVCAVDNLSQSTTRNIEKHFGCSGFEFVQEDVRNEPAILRLAEGATVLVHLAAYKIPRYGNALDTLTINVHGTESVLKAAREHKSRVVFASTSDVYGKNPHLPFAETHDLYLGETNVKRWAYAVSKIMDEHYAFAYQQEYGVSVTALRFFGGYGPGQNTTWWGGPQSVFIDAALKDQPMEIHGDGLQTRSFTYISDHVDGILRTMFSPKAVGEIFNLGNVHEISILDLALLVWRLAGRGEPKVKLISYQAFGKYEDVRNRVPEISKARELLGFEPKVGLEEGLRKTIEWQRSVTNLGEGHS
ncbi:MAG: GDP-mannose 4,6-dehydratase [Acidobacteria bacterium]|nr:GDP-mannose 4,6-dehydratase [Acidobacteriota bacterium]MCI0627810.1 GDP-mannose 4,6-dehydratase [Acidobacteriota bacterium]